MNTKGFIKNIKKNRRLTMNKKIAILRVAMLLSSTAWAGATTTVTGISNASGAVPIVSNKSVSQPQASVSTAGTTTTATGISNASGAVPIVSSNSVPQPQASVTTSGITATGTSTTNR